MALDGRVKKNRNLRVKIVGHWGPNFGLGSYKENLFFD